MRTGWSALLVIVACACGGGGDGAGGDGATRDGATADGATGTADGAVPTGYPDETTTGVPSGTVLGRVPGDVTSGTGWSWVDGDDYVHVTGDGAALDALEIAGCVVVDAADVTITRSRVRCPGGGIYAQDTGASGSRVLIEDTEIDCGDTGGTALGEANLTARRVNIHGCENGFDVNHDFTIEDSYIHDLFQSTEAHSDGLQASDGSHLVIRHNTIYADTFGACGVPEGHTETCGGTAAVNINNNAAGPATTDVTIANNLLAGGAYTLYCPIVATTRFTITDNHFSTRFYPEVGAFGVAADCAGETASGHVIHETDEPVSLE